MPMCGSSCGTSRANPVGDSQEIDQKNIEEQNIQSLDSEKIAQGLKEALTVATHRVVEQLGAFSGFLDDPALYIPLSDNLMTVDKALRRVGLSEDDR